MVLISGRRRGAGRYAGQQAAASVSHGEHDGELAGEPGSLDEAVFARMLAPLVRAATRASLG